MGYAVPIALCIYNRPQVTYRTFQTIRSIAPERLLVIGDGPKHNDDEDAAYVELTRQIVTQIDWPCDVEWCLAEKNMGCRLRMTTGLDWAFQQAEQLVILEDDCCPTPSFFAYCQRFLQHYAADPRVMMISGNRFTPVDLPTGPYFSRWAHIWGWASWRRAWQENDLNIHQWPQLRATEFLSEITNDPSETRYWQGVFDLVHQGAIDTWDFSWMFSCWRKGGLTLLPPVNLVTNWGFDESATHTKDSASPWACLPSFEIEPANITPPEIVESHAEADRWTFDHVMRPPIVPDRPRRRRGWRGWWPSWSKALTG